MLNKWINCVRIFATTDKNNPKSNWISSIKRFQHQVAQLFLKHFISTINILCGHQIVRKARSVFIDVRLCTLLCLITEFFFLFACLLVEIPCKYGAYYRIHKTLCAIAVEKMFKFNWIHSHSCCIMFHLHQSNRATAYLTQ